MENVDKKYIAQCLNGHPDEFRHLVQRYQRPLLAHMSGLLGERHAAEEAAQETLVRAYFNLPKLKKQNAFFSWLLGIGSRVAKEQIRKKTLQKTKEMIQSASDIAEGESELSQNLALESAISELSESHRQIILLKYYAGYSCTQLSEQLDMPIGTVTKTLSRAYTQLREIMKAQNSREVQS